MYVRTYICTPTYLLVGKMCHSVSNLQGKPEPLAPGHGLPVLPHLLQIGEEITTGCKLHKNEELF